MTKGEALNIRGVPIKSKKLPGNQYLLGATDLSEQELGTCLEFLKIIGEPVHVINDGFSVVVTGDTFEHTLPWKLWQFNAKEG